MSMVRIFFPEGLRRFLFIYAYLRIDLKFAIALDLLQV